MELPKELLEQFPNVKPIEKKQRKRRKKPVKSTKKTTRKIPRVERMKSCGKKVYDTQEEAKKAAISFGLLGNAEQEEYKCPICNFWHLTTKL